jgi:tripartite-type tricarboxylate transporter receptor subunit TctC
MRTTNRRRFLTLASAVLAAPALSRRAFADVWPKDKIIRAVVPFSAGSTVDIIGRVVLDPLARQIGQTIIVENRGGANGMIAAEAVAKSRPDGRTILVSTPANNYIGPELRKDMRFNPARDLAQVTLAGVTPIVLPRRGPDHRPTKWRSLR